MDKKLLTVPQAAEVLVMSESWVKGQIRAGLLKATRLGRVVRVCSVDLDEFIDKHRGKSAGSVSVPGESGSEIERGQLIEKTVGVSR